MKSSLRRQARRQRPQTQERGVALVTVMSILTVMAVLAIAILMLSGQEQRSAVAYSDSVRVRQLADIPVNLVLSQIREATRPERKTSLFGQTSDSGLLWASQPGMIRTFKAEGGLAEAWKLYSSGNMRVKDPRRLLDDSRAMVRWEEQPHRYVDMNAPAITYDLNGRVAERHFPIMDPRAHDVDQIEGFTYDDFPGAKANERLPMPVEWLYMLKDGRLGTLDPAGKFVSTDPEAQVSAKNPIVARLAFWTDDETSKINVNTASEGVPWAVPKATTEEGKRFAEIQPVTNEVQRYPGHPATTCLSSVFFPDKYVDGDDDSALSIEELEAITELAPKVRFGGTEDGTKRATTPITLDKDRLYASVDDAIFNVDREDSALVRVLKGGRGQLNRARGVLTNRSNAPELNAHGRPRISLWPVHETDSDATRTVFDQTLAFASTLRDGEDRYFFQRADHSSRHGEFYRRADRANVDLFMYLMHQVYRDVPGYGDSLAEKYGATRPAPFKVSHYRNDTEYKLDHFAIPLMMFDYIRGVNLHDGTVERPYAPLNSGDSSSFGQIAGINLIGRNLTSDDGSSQQANRWFDETLEPRGAGRLFTLSEAALVIYKTSTVRVVSWSESSGPQFEHVAGQRRGDGEVIQRIVANQHPQYATWMGREFGPEDVGHAFSFIEVGMVPEIFSVSQGFHQIHPKQSMRLLVGGRGYAGGFDEVSGLRLNGVPLQLWGDSAEARDGSIRGPMVMTADPASRDIRGDLPKGWYGWGGSGGYRIMRFGTFDLGEASPGWHGTQFLANGDSGLRALYCQTPVIVRDDEEIVLRQDAPVRLALYDSVGSNAVGTGNIVQLFNLRWAEPGEAVTLKQPEMNVSDYRGWTRRFRRAAEANARENPIDVLERQGHELVKSLTVSHGDYRLVASKRHVPSELFRQHPRFTSHNAAHSLTWALPDGAGIAPGASYADDNFGRHLVKGVNYEEGSRPDFTFDPADRANFAPLLSSSYRFPIDPTITRDFDNGTGRAPDGAYIRKADDGADEVPGANLFNRLLPYYDAGEWSESDSYADRANYNFSPNRMVPSAVTFGSLPSASQANAPWTTLLFRPHVSTEGEHMGEAGNGMRYTGDRMTVDGFESPQLASVSGKDTLPPDHLWLDLFWMPIVEPYPISDPFSTMGKVNLNYQMMPFTHVHRATALHAVLKSERLLAIPTSAGRDYKKKNKWNSGWYHKIDAEETLKQWQARFDEGEIFQTASEVCEMFLYPQGEKWDADNRGIRRFWDEHRLSGDNTLEQPYANIYPRITTKSNTFKVHMTVQTLQKARGTDVDTFVPGEDLVTAEYRGSAVIERFLDPNAPDIPAYLDHRSEHRQPSLEHAYQYRVVSVRQFAH